MSNKLYWIRPTHLIVSVDSPLLRSLLGWKEGPSTPVSNDNVFNVCGTKARNHTKGNAATLKGSSQDYGGLAYTTTSEPEFHMNEILHLARGLTP